MMDLRKLWPWEREQLRAHLLRLDAQDRRLRFCRPVGDGFVHRYCDQIDWAGTTVIGCFAERVLRGVAELVRLSPGAPVGAEIALSVEGPYQRRGIGGRLLEKALLLARNRMLDTVFLLSLAENEPVRHLARRHGAQVTSLAASAEGCIRLPWPSHVSLLQELAGDGLALVGAVLEPPVEALARGGPAG